MKFRECTIGDHGHCIKETKTEGKCSCICHEIDMERDDTDCKW